MWFVYALAAAVIWGISYAASGRAIGRGIAPHVLFMLSSGLGALVVFSVVMLSGRIPSSLASVKGLGADSIWLVVAVIASCVGSLLIYMAIGEKNATVASLIEISYPLFVAFFAWLFFREAHLNLSTIVGAALILSGVAVVFLGNR